MRRGWWLALACWGCSGPITVDPLARGELDVVVSFDVQPSYPPLTAASLRYPAIGECPGPYLAAALDGVDMDRVAASTGVSGDQCRVTFRPGVAPVRGSGDSTVSLTNGDRAASLMVSRLFEPRTLTPALPDGGDVRAGDVLDYTWSTDSDRIATATATFATGAQRMAASTEIAGSVVHVTVPALSAGTWTLDLLVVAKAHVTACDGLAACSAQVIRAISPGVTVR